VPENCEQGIFFGSVKNQIVAVFIEWAIRAESEVPKQRDVCK